jgi:hypothetical protein
VDCCYYEGTIQGDVPVTVPYTIVTVTGATKKVTVANANGGNGIIIDVGSGVAGSPCTVVACGHAKLLCNEAVVIGAFVTSRGTDGAAKAAGSGHVKVALVLSAAAGGQLADVCVLGSGATVA